MTSDNDAPGYTRADYDACLAYAKERNYRAFYWSIYEDGYDPSINWRALMKDEGDEN